MALCNELMDRLRHHDDVVKDEEVRDQVMILDHFALFVSRIFGQQPTAAEGHPLHELIERLAFVRRALDRPTQF
jgi:hypothetical protein